MPIALSNCIKNYPSVYRNPETLREGRYDLERNIRLFEKAIGPEPACSSCKRLFTY
jgi:hypothetical protein